MKKILLFFVCLILAGVGALQAQNVQVSGVVTNAADGTPLSMISVVVKGTKTMATTGDNGRYTISAPSNAILEFTSMGVKTLTIGVDGRTTINVTMEASSEQLDEVLVVAYGTAKKGSYTGSAEVVRSEKLEKRTVANVTKALDGMVAGVQSTAGTGQPGSGATIMIRGFGSIYANNEPLYVVDGIPYSGSMSAINPSDIESVTLLKDAAASALYGSRAANGVVMITTKRGKIGADKTKVSFKANWGVASPAMPRYETMNEKDFMETMFLAYKNELVYLKGVDPSIAGNQALADMASSQGILGVGEQYNPFNYPVAQLIDPITGKMRSDAALKYHQDWYDEGMANNPLRQEYSLSVAGASNKTTYLTSIGYLDEKGLLQGTSFQRFSGRANIDTEAKDWLKTGLGLNVALNKTDGSASEGGATTGNTFYTAQLMGPIYPVYVMDNQGNYVLDANGNKQYDYGKNRPSGAAANSNAIGMLHEDRYWANADNVSGRTYISLLTDDATKYGVLNGFNFTVNLGFDYYNNDSNTYYNTENGNAASSGGRISKTDTRILSYTLGELLSYKRQFGKHQVDALVGHEWFSRQNNYILGGKTGFPFADLYELSAAATIANLDGYQTDYRIESYFGRLNYTFDNKYYLSFSYRTDGSSRFKKEVRWGDFWSVGANWQIKREAFLANVSWLDALSMKASYGMQGNDRIQDKNGGSILYAWQSLYDLLPNASYNGAVISSLETPDVTWEKIGIANIGVDFRIFDRISASVEWYYRKTTDMLMQKPMALSLGFSSYNSNVGDMKNTGLDFTLDVAIVRSNNFDWKMTFLGSIQTNEILRLPEGDIITGNTIHREGDALGSFYLPKSAGVDPATGKQLYWVYDTADGTHSDSYISADRIKATNSREVVGNRIPDFYGSISTEFTILKQFDLSVMTAYSIGGKILDGVYSGFMQADKPGATYHEHVLRAWKNPGDITDVPRIILNDNYTTTDSDLIDASYFSIRNITLGYTFPSSLTNRIKMSGMRVFASFDNPFLFTHLKGMNPQYNFTGTTAYSYVPSRTLSFGIDIKF